MLALDDFNLCMILFGHHDLPVLASISRQDAFVVVYSEKLCFIDISGWLYELHYKTSSYDFMSREHGMLCWELVNRPG
jgi:hypothetical protein